MNDWRKDLVFGVLKGITLHNKGKKYKRLRQLIMKDYTHNKNFVLEHTNIDKRGTDWTDNVIRYWDTLNKWKKQ